MEKPVASDKAKKLAAIAICSFFFVWMTIFVTGPSIMFEILPKHYIVYLIVQGAAHIITYKVCKFVISNYKAIEFNDGNVNSWNSFDYNQNIFDDNITSTIDYPGYEYRFANPYSYDRNYYSPSRD